MSNQTFEPGQIVYLSLNNKRAQQTPLPVTIRSVGRKWVRLSNRMKFEKGSPFLDGGQYASPGRWYLTQEDYRQHMVKIAAWDELREFVSRRWAAPENINADQIRRCHKILTTKDS